MMACKKSPSPFIETVFFDLKKRLIKIFHCFHFEFNTAVRSDSVTKQRNLRR